MAVPPFSGIRLPQKDELTLYVVGSSFGESSIVVTPEGKVVVVDSCTEGKVNLTLLLLEALGIKAIDLLIVTHSDLDHIRGIPSIVSSLHVTEAWRFPAAADLRALAAKWLRQRSDDRRLRELAESMDALDQMARTNRCVSADSDTRPWMSGKRRPVRLHCLAPSQRDQMRVSRALEDLIRLDARRATINEAITQFFDRSSRKIGVPANTLSLAVAVEWVGKDARILLGGDVERGDGTESSGWRGVLTKLERQGARASVQGLGAVKVAHHGSRGAFEDAAWDEHVRAQPDETWAIVAPFHHGNVQLPDNDTLRELRERGTRLAICDAKNVTVLARRAGFSVDNTVTAECDGPLVGLVWKGTHPPTPFRGQRATVFRA